MSLIERLAAYWPAENRRLQWMIYCIAGLLLLYLLLAMHDYRVQSEALLQVEVARLQKLSAVARESGWEEHAGASQAAKQQAESLLWKAPGEGVAKATIQSALEALLEKNKVVPKSMLADAITESDSGFDMVKVVLSLNGDFNSYEFYALLHDLEKSEKRFVVEELDITSGRRNTFKLLVAGYARVEEL